MSSGGRFLRAVAAVLFLGASAYIGAGLFAGLDRRVETAVARPAAVTDSVALQGIAIRREQLVCSPGGLPTAEEGRRVPAGGLVGSANREELYAPASALFFSGVDGLERLGPDRLRDLSVASLRDLLAETPEPVSGALGRLVLDYDWYFAALAPAGALPEGLRDCTLSFENTDRRVPARLLSVSPAEDGQTALLLRLTAAEKGLYSLRKTSATLVLAEYAGLELPAAAVRTDGDGHEFVYTVAAGVAERREVTILYRAGDRCIAALTGGADALREGSRVIVSGDVQDGKVLF